jgi:hypothetical protein
MVTIKSIIGGRGSPIIDKMLGNKLIADEFMVSRSDSFFIKVKNYF